MEKRLSQPEEKSALENGGTLQITEPDISKEDNNAPPTNEQVSDADVKMPSVKELVMKFKSSSILIQPKPPSPVKKISTTTPPAPVHLVSMSREDEVQPKVQLRSTKIPDATSKEFDVHHVPTPVKRTSKPLKQSFTEEGKSKPDDGPQKSIPIKSLETENPKSPTEHLDVQTQPVPTKRITTSSTKSVIQSELPNEELTQLKAIEDEQSSTDEIETRRQPPSKLEIETQQAVPEEDSVFSPPLLPKTPPPNKVPFFPPVPKTPPPQKTPFFSDQIDSSLSIITPPSEGNVTDELLLSIIPGKSILLQQNEGEATWDVFAEINNNTKKSIETKLIFNAAATEVYEKTSPKEVQKTFLDENSNKESSISPEKSLESSNEEKISSSEGNEELLQTLTDAQVVSKLEDTITDSSSTKSDVPFLRSFSTTPTLGADEILNNKVYHRQTSEMVGGSASPMRETVSRPKSLPPPLNIDTERRKTAIEVLATPPVFRPKEEQDLIKLRSQILRASRSGMATPKTSNTK